MKWDKPAEAARLVERANELAELIRACGYWRAAVGFLKDPEVKVAFGPPGAWLGATKRPNRRKRNTMLASLVLPEDWKETVYDLGCCVVEQHFILQAAWQRGWDYDHVGEAVAAHSQIAYPHVVIHRGFLAGHAGFWAFRPALGEALEAAQDQLRRHIGLQGELPF